MQVTVKQHKGKTDLVGQRIDSARVQKATGTTNVYPYWHM